MCGELTMKTCDANLPNANGATAGIINNKVRYWKDIIGYNNIVKVCV